MLNVNGIKKSFENHKVRIRLFYVSQRMVKPEKMKRLIEARL